MKVLVLGCGPAGLIAAHGARSLYADVLIFSKARQSYMKGAQYLHAPIPGISQHNDAFKIKYTLQGTEEGYQEKVYGIDKHAPKVSPQDLRGIHPAWDIRAAYDKLWHLYGKMVRDVQFTGPEDVDALITHLKPDVTISTIPATQICLEDHSFTYEKVWSTDLPMAPLADNVVVCNGHEAPAWYRAARIQGFDTVEWPYHTKPPLAQDHLWEVTKPISNNCTCFPDVVRMGRYGLWTKGVLSHEAFKKTQDLMRHAQDRLF